MTQRRVQLTHYTLRRITASVIKDLIVICLVGPKFASNLFNAYDLLSNRYESKKKFLTVLLSFSLFS